jgi:MFS transporter, DHA1 family, multidrug resistance protein
VIRLALALFAIQAGFHGYTASLPLALGRGGVPDPEIGFIVGIAAIVQVPAALVFGVLLDRFGGTRMLVLGSGAYLLASGILLLPIVEPGGVALPFIVVRILQGIGVAGILPAALSLIPRLAPPSRRGLALAFVGSSHNLTLVVLPPLSIAILGATSLDGVAISILAIVGAGLALAMLRPLPLRDYETSGSQGSPKTLATRRLGFAVRRAWTAPLAIALLFVIHWGVVTSYLPTRADAAGANVGLFFVADGIAVLLLRVPSGWLADRIQPRILVLAGLASTFVAVSLLVLPPTTMLLMLSGAGVGAGAGLVMTPLLVELSRRSTDADRGSAFALYSAMLAVAIVVGSIGTAPIIAFAGFEGALVAPLVAVAIAAAVASGDPGMATSPARARSRTSRA